ncbi:DUF4198 domain-containing protein [Granulicella sp. WH15]|uniref:DUF4198 domain-containing protein n=1 Tax=Granulicella sp. WH15 TaxID=2602070 RepID=UPI0021023E63|nr:DUF4198 domain-containing protein [Granulicella sp. WH15]
MTFRRIPALLLCALSLAPAAALADTLTGVVTNKTTNKPAAGDEVTLIRLQQGMQESTHTKTDAKGRFTLDVPDPGLHLVRVTHDKANYFRPAPPGTQSVELEVFNAKPKVDGISIEADVMRIQTDGGGQGLTVVEHYFVKNESSPPMTQFSDRPFEFYLPAGAVIQGSAALAPNGMPVQAPPVPLGEPNHYTFIFPIRPGETQFQITYRLPYKDSFTFSPRPVATTGTIAIMMPKSMAFKPSASTPYNPVNDEVNAQTYVAQNVQPSQPLSFTVSGSGQLPRDSGQQGGGQGGGDASGGPAPGSAGDPNLTPAQASAQMRADTAGGKGLGAPLDSEGNLDPWAKYKWWTIGGLGLLLAAAAGLMLRSPSGSAAAVSPSASRLQPTSVSPLQVLRDELFAAETDRLQGRITEAEYTELKAALDTVLRRALARTGVPAAEAGE